MPAIVLALWGALVASVASAGSPVVIPGTPGDDDALLLVLVPGAGVPPSSYGPFVAGVGAAAAANLFGAIVDCGDLELCNPIGRLPGELESAIDAAAKANGRPFPAAQIIISGHSLGGVGARHYFDTAGEAFAGLALFGTEFNGDHEDFKGPLGYPLELARFPAPILSLLGELDPLPGASHAGLLYDQYRSLGDEEQTKKPVVILPGVSHSQICAPHNVSGDLKPEVTNEDALASLVDVTAKWVDGKSVSDYVANGTEPITRAWLSLKSEVAVGGWCADAQLQAIRELPEGTSSRVSIDVNVVRDRASLEHSHTNFSLDNGTLHLSIASLAYAPNATWNPIRKLAPSYASASDVSCKLVSSDRVAEQLNLTGFFPNANPPTSCAQINGAAVARALESLGEAHPPAVARWARRRYGDFTFAADAPSFAGPAWVFATRLNFELSPNSGVLVSSPRLYSSIDSPIYPGNLYCKVLSPAKALEVIQTTGLGERYEG